MIDTHTHILPGMDDGAANVEESIRLLKEEFSQGVKIVALTPHFYRDKETVGTFLERREKAYLALQTAIHALSAEEQAELPSLVLGAEVAWMPNMSQWPELEKLCYENTKYLLLELPFGPWNPSLFQQLYDFLGMTGIVPVIAHIDRYWSLQGKKEIAELYSLGLPTQISAEAFLHFGTRGRALRAVKEHQVHMLITDCHNFENRKPNFASAVDVIMKKFGRVRNSFVSFPLGGEEA